MPDFYYVLKHDGTGKYLAETFHHLQWTDHLSKAKRFTKEAAEHAMCKILSTHAILVCAFEVNEPDIIEVEEVENANNATD